MSNRFLSFIILLVIFVWGFIYLFYFYLPQLWEELNNKNTSSGNIDTPFLIQVDDNNDIENTELLSLETNEIQNNNNTSVEDRIESLRDNLSSYKIINIWGDLFKFIEENNNLNLFHNNKIIWNFNLVSENLLDIKKVYSKNWDFFIIIWNQKYLYNSSSNLIKSINLNITIDYIKTSWKYYLIKTDKWIFQYDNREDSIEYIDLLEDFIYYKEWYVWILKNTDSRRIKNFWIEQERQNIIFYYNPITKEKNIIYKTSLNLTKIYLEEEVIYFEENWTNTYKLANF